MVGLRVVQRWRVRILDIGYYEYMNSVCRIFVEGFYTLVTTHLFGQLIARRLVVSSLLGSGGFENMIRRL